LWREGGGAEHVLNYLAATLIASPSSTRWLMVSENHRVAFAGATRLTAARTRLWLFPPISSCSDITEYAQRLRHPRRRAVTIEH
jgi:hypothetical protein